MRLETMIKITVTCLCLMTAAFVPQVQAKGIKIVAFGASHTYSKGVSRQQAYPAQLQRILRAKGVRAVVFNKGRNGNTTGQMLARLNASAPKGTKVVIFQPGGNDRRKGFSAAHRQRNIGQIKRRLKARNIQVIMMPNRVFGQMRKNPSYVGRDGQHLSPLGYRVLARKYFPKVMGALSKSR